MRLLPVISLVSGLVHHAVFKRNETVCMFDGRANHQPPLQGTIHRHIANAEPIRNDQASLITDHYGHSSFATSAWSSTGICTRSFSHLVASISRIDTRLIALATLARCTGSREVLAPTSTHRAIRIAHLIHFVQLSSLRHAISR